VASTSVHDLSRSGPHHHQGEAGPGVKEHEHVQKSAHRGYPSRVEPYIKSVHGKDVGEAEHLGETRVSSIPSILSADIESHESMKDKGILEEKRIDESVKGEQYNKVISKQSIPDEEENPQLRAYLIFLWDQRQARAVAMNESLVNDDMEEYAF
jgi:hypothetical protein